LVARSDQQKMSGNLLEKTRRLSKAFQNNGPCPVDFTHVCNILSEILDINVYIIGKKGQILGYALSNQNHLYGDKDQFIDDSHITKEYNSYLLKNHVATANVIEYTGFKDMPKLSTIIPIHCGSSRLGTLIFERLNSKRFTEEDLVMAEYSATVFGLELMYIKQGEVEEEARNRSMVQMAVGTLSYSELEALGHIFKELDGEEGLLVASKIADRAGITRSVIVNALRKLESAGIIESRSLGMKGTYIKILNNKLLSELEKA
jgi:transcriptional pleiotropic repressor